MATAGRVATDETPGLDAALGDEPDELQLGLEGLIAFPVFEQALVLRHKQVSG